MKKIIRKLFYADKWNIGYVEQSTADLIKSQRLNSMVNWLIEDSSDYSADPFVIDINSKPHIFYEDLNFIAGKGDIFVIDGFSFANKKKVSGITPGIHLSYPYMFNEDDKFYCIPETCETNEVALYEVDPNNPSELEKVSVLLAGKRFLDSSIVKRGGKYWLFTTVDQVPDKLYIYYSDSLFEPFKAHQLNPIQSDSKNMRGAGTFFEVEGQLYWPTQNHEIKYGGSILINRITALTSSEFEWEKVFEIFPQHPYAEGLHNISFGNNLIVVDGKRKVRSLYMPVKKAAKKIFESVGGKTYQLYRSIVS